MSIRIEVYEFIDPSPGQAGGGAQPYQPSYVPAHPDYPARAEIDYGDGYADAASAEMALVTFANYNVDYLSALQLMERSPKLDCLHQTIPSFGFQAVEGEADPDDKPYNAVLPTVYEVRNYLHLAEPSQDDALRPLIISAMRLLCEYLKYNFAGLPITQTVITGPTGLVNLNAIYRPAPATAEITYGRHVPLKKLATLADETVSVTRKFRMVEGVIQLLPYTLFSVKSFHTFWNPTTLTVTADDRLGENSLREAVSRLVSYWFDATGEPLEAPVTSTSQAAAIRKSGALDIISPYIKKTV